MQSNFQAYLKNELVRRCKANPLYSLRSFARLLNVSPSFLSKILRGQRRLTDRKISDFSQRLGVSSTAFSSVKKSDLKETTPEITPDLPSHTLSLEIFEAISDWHHYAILELTLFDEFTPSPEWVSRQLKIPHAVAESALARLKRLGLLAKNRKGKWVSAKGNNTTLGNSFTAPAFRKLQNQILHGALQALEEIPREERDQTSLTLALSNELLPEVRQRLKELRQDLLKLQKRHRKKKNQIYQLSLSCYPVIQRNDQNRKAGPK